MSIKQLYKPIIVLTIALTTVLGVNAQQANNMYFLNNVPEARFLNPANKGEYKFYFYLPVLSGTSLNFDSNPLKVSDLLYPGEGLYADSLITPLHRTADKDAFLNKLGNKNYFATSLDIQTLGFGFKVNNMFFSLDIRERMEAKIGFPKDMFNLVFKGNQYFTGGVADFGYFGMDAIYFREIGIGYSMELMDGLLTVGARPKLLFGIANVSMQDNVFEITASEMGDQLDFNLGGGIYTNIPINTYENAEGDVDSLDMPDFADMDIASLATGFGNMGLGIDLGATFKVMENLTAYMSLVDIGYIRWKDNAKYLKYSGDYNFEGVDITDAISDTTDSGNFGEDLINGVLDSLNYDVTDGAYTTGIGPKLYVGATYDLTQSINVGFLSKTRFYDDRVAQQFTLSANAQVKKWLAATVSYSVMNNSYNNLGVGLALKGGPFQVYIMTDNIPFYPQHANNINLRFGMNIVISDKEAKPEVEEWYF